MIKLISIVLPVLLALTGLQAANPIPFVGKVARNGVNHDGLLRFVFSLEDVNGTVLWRNGSDANTTIEVPVNRGRYLVLLGGQGMNPLPANLFHENPELSLRVRIDLKDGFGLLPLSPVHRIASSPKALASELAKLAERATVADAALPGSVRLENFSPAYRSGLSRLLSPSLSDFAVDGLTPKFSVAGSAIPVPLGKPFTLKAPKTPGKDINYSWKRNGDVIEGAGGMELSITGSQGEYSVTASNALGSSQTVFSTYVREQFDSNDLSVWRCSFYIDANQTLWGVGENGFGKLGLERSSFSTEFIRISDEVVSISQHEDHLLFIKSDGSLWGLGRNHLGQLGVGTREHKNAPVLIENEGVLSVRAGRFHSLYVKFDGSLWGMGDNRYGQLGSVSESPQLSPKRIIDGGVASSEAGNGFSFALMKNGSLFGFGRDDSGQLGIGANKDLGQIHLVRDSNVTAVSCGNSHSVILLHDGSVWTMGENANGQLGVSGIEKSHAPIKILDFGAVAIGTGYSNTYFLKSDKELWGLGSNRDGQLGMDPQETPLGWHSLPIKIVSEVDRFAAGGWSILFTKGSGSFFGLGYTGLGQFAQPEPPFSSTSGDDIASNVIRIEAGHDSNVFWNEQGECWVSGNNEAGKLMLGHDSAKISSFVKSDFRDVRSFSMSQAFSLIVDENGSLWSIGGNSYGQLGTGDLKKVIQPLKVVETGVSQVSAREQVLYIKEDGSLWGMGRNNRSQLGDGNQSDRKIPIKIAESNVTAVATGWEFSLFLKSDGSVWTMGGNLHGRLGLGLIDKDFNGTVLIRSSPQQLLQDGVSAIAAGPNCGYLLKDDGSLWTFGSKQYGKLGEGALSNRHFPIKVVSSGVSKISAYGNHAVFVKTDGSLWGMGQNHRRQLGNDQTSDFSFPVRIFGSGVKDAKVGVEHTFVLMKNGTIKLFGSNLDGQLATGRQIWSAAPISVATGLAPKLVD